MQDPRDLREQARRWRRQAIAHTPRVAAALMLAAATLEAQADGLEAGHGRAASPADRADLARA